MAECYLRFGVAKTRIAIYSSDAINKLPCQTAEPEMPTTDDFKSELRKQLGRAEKRGAASVEINSGELHRVVGGYPGTGHRMPMCCRAMYAEQRAGDEILSQPEKGKGASLTIRYQLPR